MALTGGLYLVGSGFGVRSHSVRVQVPVQRVRCSRRRVVPVGDGREVASVKHNCAPENCRQHPASHAAAVIRGDRVAVMECSGVDCPLRIGIPHDEVGIASDGNRALCAEAGELSRAVAIHPASRSSGIPRSAAPVHTTDSPSCSDATPPHALTKSPSSRCFKAGGAGEWSVATRSIVAGGQRLPQPLAIGPGSDRRSALERGRAVADVFRGKRQVVRTRFHGQRNTSRAGCADGRQRDGGREVDDVDAGAVLAREPHEHLDGGLLARVRATLEPGGVASRIARHSVSRRHRVSQQRRQLRVRQQRKVERGKDRQRRPQIRFADVPELVDARRAQETLEAEHAGRARAAPGRRHCRERRRPRTPRRRGSGRGPRRASPPVPATLVVAGMLLSGMSTSVVTPPAAAARVACSKPSHSARPGSLMWTCVSTSPGRRRARRHPAPARPQAYRRTRRWRRCGLSRMWIVAGRTPVGQDDALDCGR